MEVYGKKTAPGKAHIDLGKSRVDYEIEKLNSGYRVTGRIRGNPGRIEVVRLPAPDSFLMNNWQSWGPLQKVSPATRFPEYEGIRAKRRGVAVIFITHNPNHAYPVGDHFVVLRRGQVLGDYRKDEISRQDLINLMAGGEDLIELQKELTALLGEQVDGDPQAP